MALFSELLDGITVTVTSPDGNIECDLTDGRNVVVGFAPGSYRRYQEAELARQLGRVLSSLWVAHRRAHLTVLNESSGCAVRGSGSRIDRSSREFTEARETVRAAGRSESGRIVMSSTGLTRWEVRIRPDTVRQVNEEVFLNDLWTGFLAVMSDYRRQLAEVRRQIFDAASQSVRQ